MMDPNDFRLITLGRLELLAPTGSENAALGKQRRKLAVLAVLALAGRPVARDTLGEMFWGDQDEARARHSLSEALSHLRRTLGPGAVTTRQADVALAEGVALRVDALEFTAAVKDGAYARALELHNGPFLEAVYVGGSSGFQEWADRERRRLEELFLRACDEHSEALARQERWGESAGVALRWLEADPLSADAAAALLDALAAPGTREAGARALREYERLRARLERDFGLAPDPVIAAAAERIRDRLGVVEAPEEAAEEPSTIPTAHGTTPPEPSLVSGAGLESPRAVGGREGGAAPVDSPTAAPPLTRRWAGLGWAALALVVVAITGTIVARGNRSAVPASSNSVAVLPFVVHGGADVEYLRSGMVDLLSTSLDGVGAFRSVDPRAVLGSITERGPGVLTPADGRTIAARFDAGYFVLGDVVAGGDRLRISASLYDRRRGREPLARATVEGAQSELFVLVDRLTARLLAAHPTAASSPLTPIAAVTTSSLPALKAYLAGEAHYRAGQYVPAFEAFQWASARDSTFALAHYRLSQSALWGGLLPWDSVVERSGQAVRHAGRLNRRTRLLVEAFHAWHRGAYDSAERLYRMMVATHPDDVEAWYQLGEVLFHSNPLRGRSFVESRAPLERVLALEPDHLPALLHLLRVAAREGRPENLDSLVRRATAVMPDQDEAWVHAFHSFAASEPADQDLAHLRGAPDETVRFSAERVAIYAGNLQGAERILGLLVQSPRLPEARALGRVQTAELQVAQGRWRSAQAHFAAAASLSPSLALEHRALLSVLPFLKRPHSEIAALRDTLVEWNAAPPPSAWPVGAVYDGLHPHIRSYLLGVLSVHLADSAAVKRSVQALNDLATRGDPQSREFARGLAESVRAHSAMSRGQYRDALAGFERGRLAVSEGLLEAPLGSQTFERFARAEALRALGRDAEALPWYASIAETTLHQVVYLAPSHLRQGEIHEKMGNPRRAAEHYSAFITLWKDSDPELRPMVERARGRLARLRQRRD